MAYYLTGWRADQAHGDLITLVKLFPKTFFLRDADRKPLKIGIRDEIASTTEPFKHDPMRLRRVLKLYVAAEDYRRNAVVGAIRVGLNAPARHISGQ
jgi:sRNA-binding protein